MAGYRSGSLYLPELCTVTTVAGVVYEVNFLPMTFKKSLFYHFLIMCLCVYLCVAKCIGPQRPKGSNSSGAGCELPDMGAGIRTQVV